MAQPLRIMSLHALAYCERLFYLEEVENLRVADERVYAGRRLHVELERLEDEDEWLKLNLESERWGLVGKVDCVRRRDGMLIPYEHKRGRSAVSATGLPEAWASDRLQVIAYAALVEEHSGRKVTEGRIRYHSSNVMVRVPIDDEALEDLSKAIARARELQDTVERPPVTENERLCVKCSLAPVCLPEEARLASLLSNPPRVELERPQLKLFPADDDRRTLHVVTQGARVGRRGDRLEISAKDEPSQLHPVHEIGQVVLHGYAQISTQALRFCGQQEIGVHWVTTGGQYMGAWSSGTGSVQRRIRQYKALTDPALCLRLAAKLAEARARGQLSFLLRASRAARPGTPVRCGTDLSRTLVANCY